MPEPVEPPRGTRLALAESTPLELAVRTLLAAERDALLAESESLARDPDPEPLHRARVAMRRTRSWLRQLRRALPDEYRELARGIARLARRSGPVRDLDLLLAWLAGEAEALGPSGGEALAALEDAARRRRAQAHATWLERWTSPRTRRLLESWRELAALERAALPAPTGPLVRARLARRHARVLRRGGRLERGSPAADFHALRIECKKLRYLLDGFGFLFDPAEATRALDALRRLQGALGDANDAEVQREWLGELGHALARRSGGGAEPWLTIGRLLERTETRRARARERSLKRFAAFRTGAASAWLARLAGAERDPHAQRAEAGAPTYPDPAGEAPPP